MIHVMRGEEYEICEGEYQAPATTLNPTSATCGELKTDGTRCLQSQENRRSVSFLKLSHHPINGPMPECEICEGEYQAPATTLNPLSNHSTSLKADGTSAEQSEISAQSNSSRVQFLEEMGIHANFGGPCETCSGEHPDSPPR